MKDEQQADAATTAVRRWAAYVEYDGSQFVGWQFQTNLRSVQGEIERALTVVANSPVAVRCAGRTDAGVHAAGQVIHFSATCWRDPRSWMLGVNANLPPDISLYWVGEVASDFDARFRAISRRYRYVILNAPARCALTHGRCLYEPRPLDVEAMNAGAAHLLGTHDFQSFRGRDCQARTPVKTVHTLHVTRAGDWVYVDIEAGGFLHNMVRNIVGTLIDVGRGAQPADWVAQARDARDRRVSGPTVASGGLYFLGAQYEPRFALPPFRDCTPARPG